MRMRDGRGAGAIGREHRLHVMAGGGADELTAPLRDDAGDRLGVFAPQRFAREDNRAGIDIVGVNARGGVRPIDDLTHGAIVDAFLGLVRRERHRGLVQRLALDHEVAARQVLGHALHAHAREDHLRAGGADVDAHRGELDVVLQPEGIVVRVVLPEIVVVMVVVGLVQLRLIRSEDGEGW